MGYLPSLRAQAPSLHFYLFSQENSQNHCKMLLKDLVVGKTAAEILLIILF